MIEFSWKETIMNGEFTVYMRTHMIAKRTGKDTDLKPGDKVGNYQMMAYLNSGAAGDVFLCVALESKNLVSRGEKYAMKIYKPWVLREPNQPPRIRREFEIGSRIIHPNLMRIYDASIDLSRLNGTFLVMEFLDGETLASFIARKHQFNIRLTIDILTQICKGVAALHDHRIIHRDLKPENIMILNEETAKVMDYGVVKPTMLATITPSDKFVGTIRNSSPELLFGEPYNYRTDIYSIGTILYNMLFGKPIYSEIKRFSNLIAAKAAEREAPIDFERVIIEPERVRERSYSEMVLENLFREMLSRSPNLRPTIGTILDCLSKREWSTYWMRKLSVYTSRRYEPLSSRMKWPDTCDRSNPIESTRVLVRQYRKASTLEGKLRVLGKIDYITLNSRLWTKANNLISCLECTEEDRDAKTLLNLYRDVLIETIDIENEIQTTTTVGEDGTKTVRFRPKASAKLSRFLKSKGVKERLWGAIASRAL